MIIFFSISKNQLNNNNIEMTEDGKRCWRVENEGKE